MLSEAKKNANKRYNSKTYQTLSVRVRRDDNVSELLTEHCKTHNVSKAVFIKKAILNQIRQENDKEKRKGKIC